MSVKVSCNQLVPLYAAAEATQVRSPSGDYHLLLLLTTCSTSSCPEPHVTSMLNVHLLTRAPPAPDLVICGRGSCTYPTQLF